MSKKYILFSVVTLISLHTYSQYNFHKLIGGNNHDRAQTAFSTSDNNYIVNGATLSFGQGSADAMLVKLDSTGQTIWSFVYGTTDYDNSEYAIETFDRNIVSAGRSNIQSGFPTSAILFKVDTNGQLLWSHAYGGIGNDGFTQVIETSDNGYAAVGNSSSLTAGNSDIFFVKTDVNGDTVFTKSYGSIEAEAGASIIQLPDNGYLIAGRQLTFPGGSPESDGILLRTDASGNLLWTKIYGDTLWDEFTALQQTSDGGFIVTGSTVSFGAGDFDILLMKTDSAGDIQWTKTFGGVKSDAAYDIHINTDNSLIISGYTESLGYGHARGSDSTNVFLLKTDDAGNLLWMEVYGDGLQDEAYRSNIASDGGYLLTGFTTDFLVNDSSQMLVVKTDIIGLTGCHESSATPVDSNIVMPYQPIVFTESSGLPNSSFVLIQNSINPANDNACLFSSINTIENTESDYEAFPNPFNNKLTITLDGKNLSSSEIIFSDVLGRIVLSVIVNSTVNNLDTKELFPGIYIVSVKNEKGISKGRILIKE